MSKKRKLKIKNVISKDKDMTRVSGKILLRKDPDFDVLNFESRILQRPIYFLWLRLPLVLTIFSESFFSLFIKKLLSLYAAKIKRCRCGFLQRTKILLGC